MPSSNINPSEIYRFAPGDMVIDKNTGEKGTVLEVSPVLATAGFSIGAAAVIVYLHNKKVKQKFDAVWGKSSTSIEIVAQGHKKKVAMMAESLKNQTKEFLDISLGENFGYGEVKASARRQTNTVLSLGESNIHSGVTPGNGSPLSEAEKRMVQSNITLEKEIIRQKLGGLGLNRPAGVQAIADIADLGPLKGNFGAIDAEKRVAHLGQAIFGDRDQGIVAPFKTFEESIINATNNPLYEPVLPFERFSEKSRKKIDILKREDATISRRIAQTEESISNIGDRLPAEKTRLNKLLNNDRAKLKRVRNGIDTLHSSITKTEKSLGVVHPSLGKVSPEELSHLSGLQAKIKSILSDELPEAINAADIIKIHRTDEQHILAAKVPILQKQLFDLKEQTSRITRRKTDPFEHIVYRYHSTQNRLSQLFDKQGNLINSLPTDGMFGLTKTDDAIGKIQFDSVQDAYRQLSTERNNIVREYIENLKRTSQYTYGANSEYYAPLKNIFDISLGEWDPKSGSYVGGLFSVSRENIASNFYASGNRESGEYTNNDITEAAAEDLRNKARLPIDPVQPENYQHNLEKVESAVNSSILFPAAEINGVALASSDRLENYKDTLSVPGLIPKDNNSNYEFISRRSASLFDLKEEGEKLRERVFEAQRVGKTNPLSNAEQKILNEYTYRLSTIENVTLYGTSLEKTRRATVKGKTLLTQGIDYNPNNLLASTLHLSSISIEGGYITPAFQSNYSDPEISRLATPKTNLPVPEPVKTKKLSGGDVRVKNNGARIKAGDKRTTLINSNSTETISRENFLVALGLVGKSENGSGIYSSPEAQENAHAAFKRSYKKIEAKEFFKNRVINGGTIMTHDYIENELEQDIFIHYKNALSHMDFNSGGNAVDLAHVSDKAMVNAFTTFSLSNGLINTNALGVPKEIAEGKYIFDDSKLPEGLSDDAKNLLNKHVNAKYLSEFVDENGKDMLDTVKAATDTTPERINIAGENLSSYQKTLDNYIDLKNKGASFSYLHQTEDFVSSVFSKSYTGDSGEHAVFAKQTIIEKYKAYGELYVQHKTDPKNAELLAELKRQEVKIKYPNLHIEDFTDDEIANIETVLANHQRTKDAANYSVKPSAPGETSQAERVLLMESQNLRNAVSETAETRLEKGIKINGEGRLYKEFQHRTSNGSTPKVLKLILGGDKSSEDIQLLDEIGNSVHIGNIGKTQQSVSLGDIESPLQQITSDTVSSDLNISRNTAAEHFPVVAVQAKNELNYVTYKGKGGSKGYREMLERAKRIISPEGNVNDTVFAFDVESFNRYRGTNNDKIIGNISFNIGEKSVSYHTQEFLDNLAEDSYVINKTRMNPNFKPHANYIKGRDSAVSEIKNVLTKTGQAELNGFRANNPGLSAGQAKVSYFIQKTEEISKALKGITDEERSNIGHHLVNKVKLKFLNETSVKVTNEKELVGKFYNEFLHPSKGPKIDKDSILFGQNINFDVDIIRERMTALNIGGAAGINNDALIKDAQIKLEAARERVNNPSPKNKILSEIDRHESTINELKLRLKEHTDPKLLQSAQELEKSSLLRIQTYTEQLEQLEEDAFVLNEKGKKVLNRNTERLKKIREYENKLQESQKSLSIAQEQLKRFNNPYRQADITTAIKEAEERLKESQLSLKSAEVPAADRIGKLEERVEKLKGQKIIAQKAFAPLNSLDNQQVDLSQVFQAFENPGTTQGGYKQQKIGERVLGEGYRELHLGLQDNGDALQIFKKKSGALHELGNLEEAVKTTVPGFKKNKVYFDPQKGRAFQIQGGYKGHKGNIDAHFEDSGLGLILKEHDYGTGLEGLPYAQTAYLKKGSSNYLGELIQNSTQMSSEQVEEASKLKIRALARDRVRKLIAHPESGETAIRGKNLLDELEYQKSLANTLYSQTEHAKTNGLNVRQHLENISTEMLQSTSQSQSRQGRYIKNYILKSDSVTSGTRLLAQYNEMHNFFNEVDTVHAPFLEKLRNSPLATTEKNQAFKEYFTRTYENAPTVPLETLRQTQRTMPSAPPTDFLAPLSPHTHPQAPHLQNIGDSLIENAAKGRNTQAPPKPLLTSSEVEDTLKRVKSLQIMTSTPEQMGQKVERLKNALNLPKPAMESSKVFNTGHKFDKVSDLMHNSIIRKTASVALGVAAIAAVYNSVNRPDLGHSQKDNKEHLRAEYGIDKVEKKIKLNAVQLKDRKSVLFEATGNANGPVTKDALNLAVSKSLKGHLPNVKMNTQTKDSRENIGNARWNSRAQKNRYGT